MMGIKRIYGFLHEKQKAKPELGNIVIEETVLVETDLPDENIIDLISNLPTAPTSPSGSNPKGISFTFGISTHPDASALILREAGDINQSEQGASFWEIPLTYKINEFYDIGFNAVGGGGGGGDTNRRTRKDQYEEINPLNRNTVIAISSKSVQKQGYKSSTGVTLLHTNGLPITEPISYSQEHSVYTFSFNKTYTAFDDSTYQPFVGKVNDAVVFGKAIGEVKLVSYAATEEYETTGTGVTKTNYHYMRVTLTFEYNPSNWITEAKIVSMSTLQLRTMIVFPFATYYAPIQTNSLGEFAQSPWPLDANGAAIPYNNNLPANYGFLATGYPLTANLTTLVSGLGLTIP